jgi:hypothetical protein
MNKLSNTKLDSFDKDYVRHSRKHYPNQIVFHNPDNGVCVVIRPTGANLGNFTVSIPSDNEKKWRKKVGEFYCYDRLDNCVCLPCRLTDLWSWEEVAESISWTVT